MTTTAINGKWNRAELADYLEKTVTPMRLACIDDSGCPLVVSVWFLQDGDTLWCATHRDETGISCEALTTDATPVTCEGTFGIDGVIGCCVMLPEQIVLRFARNPTDFAHSGGNGTDPGE